MEDQRDNPNIIGSEIIIYQTEDGYTKIDVKFEDETVWLTQAQLCELYQTSKSNISEHIKHIFEEEELDEESVVRKFRTTADDGKTYNVTYYNLDMIISLGYRIKSVNRKLLTGSGSVSHKQALEKAKSEYRKYQEITLTPVEKAYLESIKEVSKEVKRR